MAQPPLSEDLAREALAALEAAGGRKLRAAELLGIPESTFYNRLRAAAAMGLKKPAAHADPRHHPAATPPLAAGQRQDRRRRLRANQSAQLEALRRVERGLETALARQTGAR